MVAYDKKYLRTAKPLARKRRKQGYNATVYDKKKGYGVSVTRK
jgi:hypothetical protein